ncbi:MAG TPA: type II toxin-antitoxin system RelE/ParE family toxin [Terriglobia bacterium]|nr:type II toxin-antitoxin system RelE/ParE family toxin [Terriglobia bacterium]
MTKLLVRPAAAADIEEAYRWYERQRRGLGEEFLTGVDAMLQALAEHPAAYAVIYRETRRALLRRFPYAIFYRLYDETVIVIACMHGRRDPKRWKGRA